MSELKSTKNPCPPGCGSLSDVGLKLRQTHYILGKDDPNYISEYNYEYNPKKVSPEDGTLNGNRGIFLRNSHFLLGNSPMDYQTSSEAQSETIPKIIRYNTDGNLEDNKTRLQRSHFVLGNQNNDYITKYSSEFYNKIPYLNNNNKNELNYISNKLKETHISPLSDEINYESETQAKYRKPNISLSDLENKRNELKINTFALQESHLSLGKQEVPWITSNRYYLTPKKNIENKRYISTERLQQSHINFSNGADDDRNFKSENMESYAEKPLNFSNNNIFLNLKNNLRREHFNFGNEDNPNNRISSNKIDYQDPKFNKDYIGKLFKNKIDPRKYRRSNWTISNGDNRDFFKSTYNHMMTPKKPEINKKKEVNTFKSSIKIGGNMEPNDFQSEYKHKYNDNKLKINLKNLEEDQKLMETIANIRRSHFDFGDNKNDYNTTTGKTYKYDPKLAKEGRGELNKKLKNNLMNSHYELGMGNDMEKMTSNRRDFRSYQGYKSNKKVEADNTSHIFNTNRNVFDGETIYMSDYTEKPLPCPDDNFPNYL